MYPPPPHPHPLSTGKGLLHRVEEVFDCWFESGSMPYAQLHYPFENQRLFEASFPADFIAEGVDQTRGWFYTLMVATVPPPLPRATHPLVCRCCWGPSLMRDGVREGPSGPLLSDGSSDRRT